MINKLLIASFLFFLLTSCGKKGDPIYNGKKINLINTEFTVVL